MNSWAQGEGQPGLGYILFFDRAKDETTLAADPERDGRRRRAARSPTTSARSAPRRSERSSALKAGDAAFFVAGDPDKFAKFAGLARTKVGQELKLVDEGRFEFCLDRRFPDVRVERGREEDRLLAQPVLDAAGRPGGADRARTR